MNRWRAGLWANVPFRRLWVGETVSMFGSAVTGVALPMTAVVLLDASAGQMGVLKAAGMVPFLFLTLVAGVWVDRHRRRPILVAVNAGRAALLGLVPVLAALGALRIEHLIAISLLVGACTVFFELAYEPFLTHVVGPDHLVDGLSKLRVSNSVADIGGPGLAGALVGLVTAPFVLVLDAMSFAVSAWCLWRVGGDEATPGPGGKGRGVRAEIGEGARLVLGNAYLRAGAMSAGTYNLFAGIIEATLVLYAVRALGMDAGTFGLLLACGALGTMAGALATKGVARRLGVGGTIAAAAVVTSAAVFLIPFAAGLGLPAAVVLGVAFGLRGFGLTPWNIQISAMQQAVTPDALRGRMSATYLLLSLGAGAIGALGGGLLGGWLGLRPALLIGAVGTAASGLVLVLSPVRTLRDLPVGDGDQARGSKEPTAARGRDRREPCGVTAGAD